MLLPENSPMTQPPATTAGFNAPPVRGPTAMAPAMTVVATEGEQELGEQHHRGIAPGRYWALARVSMRKWAKTAPSSAPTSCAAP